MAHRPRVAAILVPLSAIVILAAADALPTGGGPYPDACAGLGFGERQCAAIVERARDGAGLASDDIAETYLLPPRGDDRPHFGRGEIVRVRFHVVGGGSITQPIVCVGVGGMDDLICGFEPRIETIGGVDMDVPCVGEPPEGCATPPPTPRPAVVAQARPLHVPALDIPLDHLGSYEIRLGEAGLPDGYLTTRSLRLADDRPTDFWITGGVRLEVRPVDPSRPPVWSRYREPFDGVEPVEAYLVFEVTQREPGAVLQVRDIVVE